ncbi:hypothetical protein D8674_011074 [Pyrus ussuriensis x Pyrus communis]|uniref:Uncharacterized protein n=1 Tax=Pyrus ussuriensis x Pyrus communis TaxID=2448454 RepID=A0A5N5FXN9_9ROSA|nr:hypothetical protein D8674_011074 [Pyrus ussuriensis x Pyrus communis]
MHNHVSGANGFSQVPYSTKFVWYSMQCIARLFSFQSKKPYLTGCREANQAAHVAAALLGPRATSLSCVSPSLSQDGLPCPPV